MSKQYEISRRERKKLNCKYAILRAARELIKEQGIEVSVEEIANKADISYPTFFNYYHSKVDLFYAIYLEEIEDLQEFAAMELNSDLTAEEKVRTLFNAVMDDFVRYGYLDLYIAGEVAKKETHVEDEAICKMFMNEINGGIVSGEFKPDIDVKSQAMLVIGVILSSTFYNCSSERYDDMLNVIISGMKGEN